MKLDVLHRDPNQVIGTYENVCLIVRWARLTGSDLGVHLRALATLKRRYPRGIAVIQVNRFSPGPNTPGLDDAGQRVIHEVVRTHGSAVRLFALVLSDAPFWIAALRSIYTRMAFITKVQIDMRPFTDLQEAVHAVCTTMKDPGQRTPEPAELVAALNELEKQRPAPIASAR
jgi:hypothetical protein